MMYDLSKIYHHMFIARWVVGLYCIRGLSYTGDYVNKWKSCQHCIGPFQSEVGVAHKGEFENHGMHERAEKLWLLASIANLMFHFKQEY